MATRGRKPGTPKTGGGSRKGRPNKATAAREKAISAAGITPLEFMLDLLRTEPAELEIPLKAEDVKRYAMTMEMRFEAAKAAAPYVHPKLSSTEVKIPEKIVHEIRVKMVKP